MRRTETPKPIRIKFCLVVDIPDVVTYTNFGDHRLRGFCVAGGQISPSPIDFHRRPCNSLALPCECVILHLSCVSVCVHVSLRDRLSVCLCVRVLRTAALDRSVWRQCCSNAISAFEERRTAALVAKRKARKDRVAARRTMMWTCDVCGRPCSSRIGLFAHRKSHR